MAKLQTLFEHQDVLSTLHFKNYTLAGVGSTIYVYQSSQCITRKQIFEGHKIHSLKSSGEIIFVLGGKLIGICSLDNQEVNVITVFKAIDWILDVSQYSNTEIMLLTSHNIVYIYDYIKQNICAVKSSEEKCILYSASFYIFDGIVFILAGTVFSEVLIWRLSNLDDGLPCKIILRIKSHKGVIFSISSRKLTADSFAICTTSDDRTVNLATVNGAPSCTTLYGTKCLHGHCGRVWKSLLLADNAYTIGEDSLLCSWSRNGDLIKKCDFPSCGGIRSITSLDNASVLIGGSDGSILNLQIQDLLNTYYSCVVPYDFKDIVPRKVAFLNEAMVCLADRKLFYFAMSSDFFCKEEVKNIPLQYVCTDLSASDSSNYFALSTICGHVLIYSKDVKQNPHLLNVGNGRRCETIKWSGCSLLAQVVGGQLKLYEPTDCFHFSSSFLIPTSKERSLMCFLRLNAFTLVGDRTGNLHVFCGNEKPKQSIFKLHSSQGIHDISNTNEIILTVGAGGKVRELAFLEGTLCILRTFSIPMETASRVINTAIGYVIAGFQGSFLQLWSVKNCKLLADLKCGGGHRSFDFQMTNNTLNFVYIKNKNIFNAQFPIRVGEVIRNSYHSKVINCFSVVSGSENVTVVSGSEDNTVRIVELCEHDISTITVFEQHISSVRALTIIPLPNYGNLLISVGGREQLVITEFNSRTHNYREIASHIGNSALADSRFMCLQVFQVSEGKFYIFVGSSDCSIRIFQYDKSLKIICSLKYTHCILQMLFVEKFLISFATDGKAVFWDLRGFINFNECLPSKPIAEFTLHQSGINSAIIKRRQNNRFLLVTGGDDSALTLTILELKENEECPWRLTSKWQNLDSHTCQITGVIFDENLLISTGIDQLLTVHNLMEKSDWVETELVEQVVVAVPDAHGLAIVSRTQSSINFCVFGKGIEIVQFQLPSS